MSFEQYELPQGKIMIALSDKNQSVGTLDINPRQELPKHNRPVVESLFQVKGKCVVKLFEDDGSAREVVLDEADSIDISPLKYHIHSNPYGEVSTTFWRANGDITEIIGKIRENSKM